MINKEKVKIKTLEIQPLDNLDNIKVGSKISIAVGKSLVPCKVTKILNDKGNKKINNKLEKLRKASGFLKGKNLFPQGAVEYQRELRDH